MNRKKALANFFVSALNYLVGMRGLEPPVSASQTWVLINYLKFLQGSFVLQMGLF